VTGSSYSPEVAVPLNEAEGQEESMMKAEEITQWEDWRDRERPPTSEIPVDSVGLVEEQLCRFLPSGTSQILRQAMEHPFSAPRPESPEVTMVSDSRPAEEPDTTPIPDPKGRETVQCVSVWGFQVCEPMALAETAQTATFFKIIWIQDRPDSWKET
jgi:hypothetical protein